MSEFVVSREKPAYRPIYDLFAVSNHYGQLSAGHYTAMAMNRGKWFHFNDHKVRECTDLDQIVSPAAYILFYARRGINFEEIDYSKIANRLDSSACSASPKNSQKEVTKNMDAQHIDDIQMIYDEDINHEMVEDNSSQKPLLLETGGT